MPFRNGYARFLDGEDFGFVDQAGKILTSRRFDVAESFSEGFALVKSAGSKMQPPSSKNYQSGFIDTKGELIIGYRFDRAESFSEGLAVACVDGKCGYINKSGSWVIQPIYAQGQSFSEGLAPVKLGDGAWTTDWGYIDKSGKIAIEPQFQRAKRFSDGRAAVGKGGPLGYVDTTGQLVIPMKYFEAYEFSEGLAVVLVKSGGEYFKEYAYIQKDGRRLSNKTYSNAGEFRDGVAWVENGNFLTKLDVPLGPLGGLAVTTSHWIDKQEKSFWKEKSYGQ